MTFKTQCARAEKRYQKRWAELLHQNVQRRWITNLAKLLEEREYRFSFLKVRISVFQACMSGLYTWHVRYCLETAELSVSDVG